ncbi:MAG TPA: CapA family protein [Acidimicrobiales bacterium]|nr:CapA family protein [Acidimicrobiales bacterium]
MTTTSGAGGATTTSGGVAPTTTEGTTTTTTPTGTVTIAAVGDMMLGDTGEFLPPDPGTYFSGVSGELNDGTDVVFGNLEGTLTTAEGSKCGSSGGDECYAFRDPPDYVQYWKEAGFRILNDANNHSFDFGPDGQAQTVATIHAAGLLQTGLPGEITLDDVHGIRTAWLAFAPYTYDADMLDLSAAAALIKQAAAEASVVVVYMHAGAEGSDADHVTGQEEYFLGEDRGNAEAFAHMAIDNGASLVIASGPHVVRGMQFYKGHLIAYSLGNFACYDNFALAGDLDDTLILHVTLSATGAYQSGEILPVQLVGLGQPEPGGDAVSFVSQLSQEDFGSTAAVIASSGAISAP